MLRILCAKAALDGDLVVDHGQGGDEALGAVDADHVEAFADKAALVEVVEEALPFGGAFALRQAKVDHLLLAVPPEAQSHQHRAAQRSGAGLVGQHDAVEHQRLVAPADRAGVEGRHRLIEALSHPTHRARADRAAEKRKQDFAELAGREPEHETGQNRPIDLGRAPGVGAQDFGRAIAARAGNGKLDVPEFGQKRAAVITRCGDRPRPPPRGSQATGRPPEPSLSR